MTKTYLAIAFAVAGPAFAELPPPDFDPQIPPDTGYSHVIDGRFPKTLSHDGRWLVRGFSIIDNKSGQVVFKWAAPGGEVARESMTVSWSPDSQRVLLIDQGG